MSEAFVTASIINAADACQRLTSVTDLNVFDVQIPLTIIVMRNSKAIIFN